WSDMPEGNLRSRRVLVLSGPNLQRLGKRQPEIYGRRTLDQIHERIAAEAATLDASVECRQSNHEGQLVDWIGNAEQEGFCGIVINPGAYTHTSYALYDALLAAGIPAVEVHLSNPEAREEFRRHSRTAPACIGKVAGFGEASYLLGLSGLLGRLATP
ncbi:MAG TPA: type II 3-dehydroquinate dehydratase, partial [Polyangiaceae bacterium]|nr:type II 3-dehydroquinate dehydratase [Polyangiaceae bacterium]